MAFFPMETTKIQRHQRIKSLLAQHTENGEDAVNNLWEPMALQIISIVGEGGFSSLYARTLFLNQTTCPFLKVIPQPLKINNRFADLKRAFEGQPPAQVNEANSLLLITLTDILASLIGEPLTTRILLLAWGHDSSMKTDKEFNNE
jgi:hypothetical protein